MLALISVSFVEDKDCRQQKTEVWRRLGLNEKHHHVVARNGGRVGIDGLSVFQQQHWVDSLEMPLWRSLEVRAAALEPTTTHARTAR